MSFQEMLIYLFVFLGPMGNILTPAFFPPATRTYYFILIFFPLLFLKFNEKILEIIALFFPVCIYGLLSAICSQCFNELEEGAYPIFRYILVVFHILFVLGMVNYLNDKISVFKLNTLLKVYLLSFFISLAWGGIIYVGFSLNFISLEVLSRFNILTQYGYGFLRFNPGSYANEYAITSSFVCSIIILKILTSGSALTKKQKIVLWSGFFLSFCSMVLGSTKAAVISFCLSSLYVCYVNKKVVKLIIVMGIGFSFFKFFDFFVTDLLGYVIAALFLPQAYASRLFLYSDGLLRFLKEPFFGSGLGSFPFIHNAYFQLLFELGIIGFSLVVLSLFFLIFKKNRNSVVYYFNRRKSQSSSQLVVIGSIHVFSFALTNHNLFHHLTWLVFFIMAVNEYVLKSSVSEDVLDEKIDRSFEQKISQDTFS